MPSPTHEEIAHKAYHIWEQRGHPHGTHDAIWLEAEAQLSDDSSETQQQTHAVVTAATVAQHAIAPTPVEREVIVAEIQKQQARAPQVPHHTGPKAQPAPPGKPIWKQAHSA